MNAINKAFYLTWNVVFLTVACAKSQAEVLFKVPTNAARELPLGVPRTVDTNGSVINVDLGFSTPAYRKYACDLLLKEANRVALELHLAEPLPITRSNIVGGFISPFGFSYVYRKVGNISTSNYNYGVEEDCKFSNLTITRLDDRCREYAANYQWPLKRLDTNTAYRLATQWLEALHMDVKGLNREYDVRVALDGYWNNVKMGNFPKREFTPIYVVSWLVKGKPPYSAGGGASVVMFLPTKTLLELTVDDPKYILRAPLVFTNLSSLFPGRAKVTTNNPGKPIYIDGSKLPTE